MCLKSVLLEKTAKRVWDFHNKHIENQRGFWLKEQFQLMNHKLRTKQNQALTGVTQLDMMPYTKKVVAQLLVRAHTQLQDQSPIQAPARGN